jgi:YYY domain-containing protein
MSQVVLAFRWYLVVQVFGLAALPLCLRLFRHLPDCGYGVSKPLGLLLSGWLFWLGATFGWLHNTVGGIVAATALLAVASLLVPSSGDSSPPRFRWLRERWRIVFITELLFALTFAAWCLVRAHMPRIQTAGGEKWMESAFLRAILRSDTFPPHDPWLSGFAISYYYFGYVVVAMVTRLAAVPPAIAFNLGLPTLFALTCAGAFSLVYNLIAADEGAWSRLSPRAVWGGLLGPLLVAVLGNLEGLLEVLHARGIGPAAVWAWLDIYRLDELPVPFAEGSWVPTRFFWWWQASRVLQDYTPWGTDQHVIDEFPSFSFILGDMHPHVLALPFVLLALALALTLYLRGAESKLRSTQHASRLTDYILRSIRQPFAPWEFLVCAICLGGLGFLNTWDFPICLFFVVAAYALAHLRTTDYASRFTHHVLRTAFLFIALLVAGLLLYLPFWIGFRSQAGGILLNLFNATRLSQFLVMFGPLVFIAAFFVADQARQSGVQAREVVRWALTVALGILGVMAFVLGLFAVLVRLDVIHPQGPTGYVAAWIRGEPIPELEQVPGLWALVRQRLLLDPEMFGTSAGRVGWDVIARSALASPIWTALGLIALLTAIALTLTRSTPHASRAFALFLLATGALLTVAVEYVYLRDNFGTRMNTVFKFYHRAWVVWAIAAAYALAGFVRQGRVLPVVVAAFLIAAGLVYPMLAIPARAAEYGGLPTLDGAAHLAETYPDDYAAIAWLNENVTGAPVILEAPGDGFMAYAYEGRISAHTGLPTLIGWAGHEQQWRGSYDEQGRREPDIETLYTSTDPAEVLTLLDKYDISYVYVGPVERKRYSPAGLAKFAKLMEPVYDSGPVTIYRRRR